MVKEFDVGNYYRAFSISEEFDKNNISGKLENGVLEIIMPRREEVKPRRIQISAWAVQLQSPKNLNYPSDWSQDFYSLDTNEIKMYFNM